jgi:AraC-like DNA-binding protein
MLQPTPIMPLARHALLATSSLNEAQAHLSSLFWPHRLRVREAQAQVHFRHNRADLERASINALKYGTEVELEADPSDDAYLVKFTLGGASEMMQDRAAMRSAPGMVCVMNPSRRLRVRLSDDHNQLTLRIDGREMLEALEREIGEPPTRVLEFLPYAHDYRRQAPRLARMVEHLCADLGRSRAAGWCPRIDARTEQSLIGTLLRELPHTYSGRMDGLSRSPTPACIRRVEAYIRAHACGDLGVEDLARAAGISARAVQSGFQRHLNTTPMAYVRDCRLERARQALFTARERGLQVAEVALACGFAHLGRFSAYYRSRYGESPSATRQRGCPATRGITR